VSIRGASSYAAGEQRQQQPYSTIMMAADNDKLPPDPTHPAVVVATAIANNIAKSETLGGLRVALDRIS